MRQNPNPKHARKILDLHNIPYKYLEYGSYFSQWRRRSALKAWTGWADLPDGVREGARSSAAPSDLARLARERRTGENCWRETVLRFLFLLVPSISFAGFQSLVDPRRAAATWRTPNNDGGQLPRAPAAPMPSCCALYFVDAPENQTCSTPSARREQARALRRHAGRHAEGRREKAAPPYVREALKRPLHRRHAQGPPPPAAARSCATTPWCRWAARNLDEILVLQGLARAKGVAASVPGEKSRAPRPSASSSSKPKRN